MLSGTPVILRKYVPKRQLEELEATREIPVLREISCSKTASWPLPHFIIARRRTLPFMAEIQDVNHQYISLFS